MSRRDRYYDDDDYYDRRHHGRRSRRRGSHRSASVGAIFATVALLWLAAMALSSGNGSGGAPTPQNPKPSYSAPCNQYFRGGC